LKKEIAPSSSGFKKSSALKESIIVVFKNGDIAVKSRDAIKLHQEKYNANSVIPHIVLASDYLTDCHQALFFQQDTLVY